MVTFQGARLGKMFAGIFHPVRGRGRRLRNKWGTRVVRYIPASDQAALASRQRFLIPWIRNVLFLSFISSRWIRAEFSEIERINQPTGLLLEFIISNPIINPSIHIMTTKGIEVKYHKFYRSRIHKAIEKLNLSSTNCKINGSNRSMLEPLPLNFNHRANFSLSASVYKYLKKKKWKREEKKSHAL